MLAQVRRKFDMAGNTDLDTSPLPNSEKTSDSKDEIEDASDLQNAEINVETGTDGDVVYLDEEEEPELHARTYIALAAMFLLNYAMVIALQAPPAVVRFFCSPFISTEGSLSPSLPSLAEISMQPGVRLGFPTLCLLSKLCWDQ